MYRVLTTVAMLAGASLAWGQEGRGERLSSMKDVFCYFDADTVLDLARRTGRPILVYYTRMNPDGDT